MQRILKNTIIAALLVASRLPSAQAQECLPPSIEGAKVICNAAQLMALKNMNPKQIFQLGADIDLQGISYTPPDLAAGVLDFRKFAVRNLTLIRPDKSMLGLFATNAGTIKNAKVYNVKISGLHAVGGLAGVNVGVIDWAQVSGEIRGTTEVGGIAGANVGAIRKASLKESLVIGNAHSKSVGGIAGSSVHLDYFEQNLPELSDVHFNGKVSGSESVGGIVGRLESGYVTRASIQGMSRVEAYQSAGGIVGSAKGDSEVSQVLATSTAVVNGKQDIGGIIGDASGTITTLSFSAAVVKGYNRIGGLIGKNSGFVSDCFTTGSVSGTEQVGGLIGRHTNAQVPVERTYTTGVVSGVLSTRGLIGKMPEGGYLLSSYWNKTANKLLPDDANARTIQQLHKSKTFKGFDFVSTWFMPPYFTPQLQVFK